MKLIMENWRNYKKEPLVERDLTDPDIAYVTSATDNQDALKRSKAIRDVYTGNIDPKFVELAIQLGQAAANTAAMLLDPTAQFAGYDFDTGKITTSTEVLNQEINSFKKKPSLLGAGGVALASLAMIPLIGGVGKLGKLSKMSKTTQLNKRIKTVLDDAQKISKELKSAGGAENIAKANQINSAITSLKLPTARRLGGYIRKIQKQINQSVLRDVRSGAFKVGNQKTFKVPGGEKLELHRVEIKINVMSKEDVANTNRKIISSGSYGSDRLGSGRGYGGDLDIELHVHPRFVNKDGTINKLAFSELNKELNKTGFHEMIHARQAARQRKGSKSAEDISVAAKTGLDDGAGQYLSYRSTPHEIAAHARDASRGATIQNVRKTGLDTLDLMSQRIHSSYFTYQDLVRARVPEHLEIIKKQVKYIVKNLPCAAFSAANVVDLEAFGYYATGNLSQKNQNIINTFSNKQAIAANPKNCARKLMERIIQEEITKLINEHK